MADAGEAGKSRALYAIGIAHYDAPQYAKAEDAAEIANRIVQSVSDVADALGSLQYEVKRPDSDSVAYLDLDADQVTSVLNQASSAGDIVIIYYTGHGKSTVDLGYVLCTKDFRFEDSNTGLKTADLPAKLVRKNGWVVSDDQPTRC